MTITNLSSVGAVAQAAPKLAELKKATQQFESMFIKDMLKSMRKGFKETHFGEVPGREMYRDMLDDEMASKAAETGGVGIGQYLFDSTKNEILRQVTATQNSAPKRENR